MIDMLIGAVAMGFFIVGQFFYRFWRQTHDRFFLLFALSFWIEAGSRVALAMWPQSTEDEPMFYLLRIFSYGLILLAIWQKNRSGPRP